MKLKKQLLLLSLAMMTAGVFTACQTDVLEGTDPKTTAKEDFDSYTGEEIDMELEAELPQPNPETRAMKENSNGEVSLDYETLRRKPVFVHLALRNKLTDSISYKTVQAVIQANGNGYKLRMAKHKFKLKSGEFADGRYEMAALIDFRGQIIKDDGVYKESKFNTATYFDPTSTNNLTELVMPLYSKYSTVTRVGNTSTAKATLNFRVMGTVIVGTLDNKFYKDAYYSGIKIRQANAIAGDVVMNFGKENELGYPLVQRAKEETDPQDKNACRIMFKKDVIVSKDKNMKAYMWCLPVNKSKMDNTVIDIYYRLEQDGDPETIPFSSKNSKPEGLKPAWQYNMGSLLPESDLMITEFGHLNPGGSNYSWIEIFNPTNKAIDLRNYGLIRVMDWKGNEHDPNYYATWKTANGFPDNNHMDNAQVQELYVSDWNTNNYQGNGVRSVVKSENRYQVMYTRARYAETYTPMLPPGKCIVLFAGAMQYHIRYYASDTNNDYLPQNSKGFGNHYLGNAVARGDCHYVLAVDNGVRQNTFANASNWYSENAGTLQHGGTHSLLLIKRKPDKNGNYDGQTFHNTVDAMAGTINFGLYKAFRGNVGDGVAGSNDWYWFGRRANTMYPMSIRVSRDLAFSSPFPPDQPIADSNVHRFLDWDFFLAPWTNYPHIISPGSRVHDNALVNGGQLLPGATLPNQ